MAISVSDEQSLLGVGKSFNVSDREAQRNVSLVVELPVLQEISNLLDVDASTWHLPQPGVRGLATCAWLTLVTSLLQELAAQACPELPDLTGLFALLWS